MSAAQAKSMICFERVTKRLGGRVVLDGIDLEVYQGETLVILGPSGAGKSVALKHMIGLMHPDEGEVTVDGESVSRARGRDLERIREKFGMLFQGSALLAWMTVAENVGLPLREHTRMDADEIDGIVSQKLALVGLEGDREKRPSELSGGMQKRVGLARALVRDPQIVLYDEPTSGLDPVTSRTIDQLVLRTRDDLGVTGVVVTHDLHSALAIGNRIALLHEGCIAELATPAEFVKSQSEPVRRFLEAQYITRKGPWEELST